jgi:hypothetical protein
MRRLLVSRVLIVGSTLLSSSQQSAAPLALAERSPGSTIEDAVPDGTGGVWVVGNADASNLVASADAPQRESGGFVDAYLAHYGADGALLYATFLGGSNTDQAFALARDGAGNLYAVGGTFSADFPTTVGAFQPVSAGSQDGFVTKFDPTGTRVIYSTHLGGADSDWVADIAVDAAGVAHLAGTTNSGPNFPITSGRCLSIPASAFHARISGDGSSVLFAACLDDSRAQGIALDPAGDAYVVGLAGPGFGPRSQPKVQFPSGAGGQGFVAKFSGTALSFAGYLGGELSDGANAVAVTSRGIYAAGRGQSRQYPGAPPRIPENEFESTAWIMKVRLDGVAVLGTKLLDGSGTDEALDLYVDDGEVVHVTGTTNSTNLGATADAAQPTLAGNIDTFYATIWMPTNTVGEAPSYLSYLGGGRHDLVRTLTPDGSGGDWVAGTTSSSDFPSVNAKTTGVNGSFLARFGQPRVPPSEGAADVVMYAKNASAIFGNWQTVSDASAAGGARLWNPDAGVPKITTPSANPPSYFELTFNATAGVPYHIWLRMKADNDYWGNDSVWLQFSDSVDGSGNPVWRTGTTSGTWVGLEDCSGCGVQGWGWNDNGYGVAGTPVTFASSGTHTVRIQQREDGISIDQVVLSSRQWASTAPGANKNDTTIVPVTPPPPPPPPATAKEIVMYAGTEASVNAVWAPVSDPTAAGGVYLLNPDRAQSKLATPLASNEWFEITFTAEAATPYHLWVRSRATDDYWGNDSAFVQFSDSVDASGNPTFRIGTSDATVVSLEDCNGCGEQGWGWNDNAYNAFAAPIYFAKSGPQTIRVSRREDGMMIDQVVLSAEKYFSAAPGSLKNDSTIVPK